MLTRLKVSGFKNLVDVDVRFGPFTCIAGTNGTGKSNLFDAIYFLSALAEQPLLDAALSVRDEENKTTDIRSLFRSGDEYGREMSFEAEMIVPSEGRDDLGQPAKASTTFLRYSLILAYKKEDENFRSLGKLELLKEELVHIKQGEAHKHLRFPHKISTWRKSVLRGTRRGTPFISTEQGENKQIIIKLHQDGGSRGGSVRSLPAATLPRTVLSNTSESPTALLARQEMRSWRLLHLEPAALRKPDKFIAPHRLGMDGSHLAKTLYHLVGAQRAKYSDETDKLAGELQVYAQITNRIAELQDDVHHVRVERDDKQELLTIQVAGKGGTFHPARALSDGMLRFLALAVLKVDTEEGLLCLEEPENGIHPRCIDAMLDLLHDIAMDTEYPADEDNPLRQVIINTHSPSVVTSVPDDSLLVAELREAIDEKTGQRFNRANFACLADTWRAEAPEKINIINKGDLLAYLNPVAYSSKEDVSRKPHRVKYRADLQLLLPFPKVSRRVSK